MRLVEWLFWCGVRGSDCGPTEGSNGREASYGCSVDCEVRTLADYLGNLDDFRSIVNL